MSYKWYLIDATGSSETEVKADLDLRAVWSYGHRLHRRWTGDPTQNPMRVIDEKIFDRVRSALRKGTEPDLVAELQAVLNRETDDGFYLHQIRFRAGLGEGEVSIDQMKLPLRDWPDEILEMVVPVLFEIGTALRDRDRWLGQL
jgi:hypothetical protein